MAERSARESARRRKRRSAALLEHADVSANHLSPSRRTRAETSLDIAGALQRMGLFREASEFYLRSLESRPGNAEVLRRLGDALRPLGRLREAEECYRLAIEREPDDPSTHHALGLVLHDMNRLSEAADAYRAALALDVGQPQARFLLSSITGENTPKAAPRELIEDLFDLYAHRFDAHLRDTLDYRAPERMRELYDSLSHGLRKAGAPPPRLDVLDLGCGTGLCGSRFRDLARRLVGVDLSSGMLTQARRRTIYDELRQEDILDALRRETNAHDLVLAADVFVYLGDLAPVFQACRQALRRGGVFLFTTENEDVASYAVAPSGRFVHSPDYVTSEADAAGFTLLASQCFPMRRERDEAVTGDLFALSVPAK